MKIGSIFTIGGWFLVLVGAMCALIFGKGLFFEKGQGFSLLLAVLVLGVIPIAAGLGLVSTGRRRSRLEQENEERGFSDAVTALARKHGGQVAIDQVCKTTGLPADEAQARMRALCGRGVFDLDFDANGQMVYKLSAAQGAAQLAQLSQRS
jgi:hypothetical protein